MSGHLELIRALDELYAAVVEDPRSWDEEAFAEWLRNLGPSEIGRAESRWVRRGVRAAVRLAGFWSGADAPPDWRSAVDSALGSRGWTATYELARLGAEATLAEDLFDEMADRFRLIRFEPYPLTYEAWVAKRRSG